MHTANAMVGRVLLTCAEGLSGRNCGRKEVQHEWAPTPFGIWRSNSRHDQVWEREGRDEEDNLTDIFPSTLDVLIQQMNI